MYWHTHSLLLQPQYIGLESLCQDYGFELLGMCRNQSEVTAVLNDLGEDSETEPEAEGLGQAFEEGIPNLARLRLAVNYNQKQVSWASCLSCPPSPGPSSASYHDFLSSGPETLILSPLLYDSLPARGEVSHPFLVTSSLSVNHTLPLWKTSHH